MSFLKRVGRKLGATRKSRAEASQETTSPTEGRRRELEIQTSGETRGISDVRPSPLDVSRPQAEAEVQHEGEIQTSEHNKEHRYPQANQVSISGGTFNNAGRDVISQTHIHNQYINEESRDSRLFEALNPIPAAHDCEVVSSKVSECFAGTRQQLLHDIETWRTTGSVPIFILDGIAGIGKSTIVKTVCAQAAAEQSLAASWFFSRDEQDRKTTRGFVRTLAYQLASHHPTLRERISEVLKSQPDILQKAIRMQFDALVHEPLRGVFENQSETHTISIDAIDECNLTEAVELLSILLNAIPQHPGLRLLVTCRPERPFRLLLQKHRAHRAVFHLHEIENSVAQADIRLYINHRLSPAQIDEALPDLLPPPWRPSPEETEVLVQLAGKLFIVASTAISFILDPRRLAPAKQMARLLDVRTGAGLAGSSMDHLYIQVLRAAVPEPVDDWFKDYQTVVGSIVVAADVLPIQSLASLLAMEPNGIVSTLSHLHSLIAPTRDGDAFQVHHKSFPDFVTNKSRCAIDSRFYIEASARHFHLAQHCLRIMVKMLKENVCELPRSDWDVDSSNLPPGTKDRIPPELTYASSYWILHMQEGLPHLIGRDDVIDQLKIFVERHLLSWLEVLAWTNRFDTAWGNVSLLSESIKKLLPVAGEGPLSDLEHVASVLRDLLRVISLHPELPRRFPMHIYLSALPFVPSESKIRHWYAKSASNTTHSIAVVSGLEQNWDPISVTFRERLKAMDLSPCGTMIATRSSRVRLYNAKSGQLLQSLGSEMSVDNTAYASVAFSSDSHCIASTTSFGVQIWDVVSGESVGNCRFPGSPLPDDSESTHSLHWKRRLCFEALKSDRMHATSLIFTPDGVSITAGTADGRLLIWNTVQPEVVLLQVVDDQSSVYPCECRPECLLAGCLAHRIEGLVALPDSPILLGVMESAVIFWDRITHQCLETIPRCAVGVRDQRRSISPPISVSLDKEMVVIDCDPFLISIYSVRTQHRICNLSGHQGIVTTTAFAPHEHLCSASKDRTVRLWDVTTASQLKCIQIADVLRHSVFSVTLGTFILSPEYASQGRMVRLVHNGCVTFGPSHFPGDTSWPPQLALDGAMLASYDGTSIMVTNVLDFIGPAAHTDNRELPQSSRFGYLPSGEVVALHFVEELGSLLRTSEVTGLINVTIKQSTCEDISHDLYRAAIIDKESDPDGLLIYGVRSGRQEFRLTLPPLDADTVYLRRPDGNFYAACLPSGSASRQDVSPARVAFSRLEGTPTPHWEFLEATGLPRASELHFLAEDSAWVLNDKRTWNQLHLPSLPDTARKITYSPNGALIAIGPMTRPVMVAGPIEDHQHFTWKLRFLNHLPHILVACSAIGFTCWDATTGQTLGQCYFQSEGLSGCHAYNGSDFLCLLKHHSALSVLLAVQLRGPGLPARVQQLCFLPDHLSVDSGLSVNPLHPHIVALSTRHGIMQIDISKCPLPFTL
ncbi:hypothetical protein BKA70DRAFT_85856 [Coprinopsis sp. MPI-PUGE-AT-0042]|nr:hypothetical protein BKA70DRAFT_85856 [Coprinopsis sp. MPI-PUGE-AT-0042]